jgi:16S rRNA (guanine966-N2)-methyltransferase
MKILAGEARGRSLKTPKNPTLIRPILGRIKKSLFDILTPFLPNSNFLDLYAGTGSVGIEALSRGATHATFIELNDLCIDLIKDNLKTLKFEKRATVIRTSATGDLSTLRKPFDLIFLGPPYKDQDKVMLALTETTILNIEKQQLLTPKGIVIAQHHKTEKVEAPSAHWELRRREKYGDTFLSFFKWRT